MTREWHSRQGQDKGLCILLTCVLSSRRNSFSATAAKSFRERSLKSNRLAIQRVLHIQTFGFTTEKCNFILWILCQMPYSNRSVIFLTNPSPLMAGWSENNKKSGIEVNIEYINVLTRTTLLVLCTLPVEICSTPGVLLQLNHYYCQYIKNHNRKYTKKWGKLDVCGTY